jgi:RAD51-like protein 1
MANMLVSEMRLPLYLAHLLAARRLDTAKVSVPIPPPPLEPHLP